MKNKLRILIIFAFSFILISCTHSVFLISSIKNSYDAGWKNDSTAFAFVSIEKIFRPATGLAKFPDGGISKNVFYRIAVYHYNIKNNTLMQIGEYQNIDFMGEISIRALRIIVNDTGIFYKLPSIRNNQINKAYRFAVNQKDSIRISKYIEQAKHAYQYNFKTKTISIFDTALFNKLDTLPHTIHGNNAEDKYIKSITLTKRGIFLKDIYPQSMGMYKKYILEGKGSKDIRDAIVEQQFPKLSNKEIKRLMNKITGFKYKLEKKSKNTVNYKIDFYSDRYNEYYNYMIKKLQNLIKSKNIKNNQKQEDVK
ncbi:hypothetical protein J7J58_03930 [candidate division WOR-3 bacterium]|nr:hypothetical protein [candidate division WOR-3 bacterium]